MEDNLDTGPELTPHLPPVPDPSTLQLQGSPVQATNQCFLHLLLGSLGSCPKSKLKSTQDFVSLTVP